MRHFAIAGLACALAACATPDAEHRPTDPVGRAVTAPLSDLNLLRAGIPPPLVAALDAPYARPADGSCTGLAAEVAALDAELGPDLDAADSAAKPSAVERGMGAVGDAAVGTVRAFEAGVLDIP
ncbi:MAG: hypothetical protein ACREVD_13130, partial [Burkholderiales bacterium]